MPPQPEPPATRRRALTLLLVAGALASACGDRRPAENDRESPPSGAPTPPVLELDGRRLAATPLPARIDLLAVPGIPPVREWARLEVHAHDGRRFASTRPLNLTGARTMELLAARGGFDFRVVERAEDGSTFVRHELADAARIAIHTLDYVPPSTRSAPLVLIVQDERIELSDRRLDALPRTAEPGHAADRDVWALRDVIAQGGMERAGSLVIRNRSGDEIVVSLEELAEGDHLDVLKRSRRGALLYRRWSLATPPARTNELRDIVELELSAQE